MEEALLQPEPIVPASLRAQTVVLLPYWPFIRKVQTLVPADAQGRLPRAIPVHYAYQRAESRLFLGPVIGAPAAALLMEGIVASGIRQVLVFGICGALGETTRIGDLILVEQAHSSEGTSRHYFPERFCFPGDASLIAAWGQWLARRGWSYQSGALVSTDAPYRETPAFLRPYQSDGVLGIDMELSAVYALGLFRGIHTAGLMMVSDALAGPHGHQGVSSGPFRARGDEMLRALVQTGLK